MLGMGMAMPVENQSRGGTGYPTALMNVAAPMTLPIVAITPSAPKLRLVSTIKRYVQQPTSAFQLLHMNVNAGSTPVNGPADIVINKMQVWNASGNALITWAASNSHTVAVGAVNDRSDVINFKLPVGWVYFNIDATVSATGFVASKFYSTAAIEANGGAEVSWLCDPDATGGYDIATGTFLTIPSGGVTTNAFPVAPAAIIGRVSAATKSVVSGITSLSDGQADLNASTGTYGGGMMRRGAWEGGFPHISFATSGNAYSNYTGALGQSILQVLYSITRIAWFDGPSNDVFAGASAATIQTRMRTFFWGPARAAGLKIVQANIIQRVAAGSADFYTTVGSQSLTGVTGYGVAGVADTLNGTTLPADLGAYFDVLADLRSVLSDPVDNHFWAAAPFSTTLTAAALSSATAFITAAAFPFCGVPIFDPLNAAGQRAGTLRQMYLSTGTPPSVTNNLFNTITVAQDNGNVVVQTNTQDGTHPGGSRYAPLGTILVASTVGL